MNTSTVETAVTKVKAIPANTGRKAIVLKNGVPLAEARKIGAEDVKAAKLRLKELKANVSTLEKSWTAASKATAKAQDAMTKAKNKLDSAPGNIDKFRKDDLRAAVATTNIGFKQATADFKTAGKNRDAAIKAMERQVTVVTKAEEKRIRIELQAKSV